MGPTRGYRGLRGASGTLARLQGALLRRRDGDDPAHGSEAAHRRGTRNAATLRANAAWERKQSGTFDPDSFAEEIRPKLVTVSLAAMMRATALSRPYCAMIRRGARVPHARHWEVLSGLVS